MSDCLIVRRGWEEVSGKKDTWSTGAPAPAPGLSRNTPPNSNGKIYCPQSNGRSPIYHDITNHLEASTEPPAPSSSAARKGWGTSQLSNGKILSPPQKRGKLPPDIHCRRHSDHGAPAPPKTPTKIYPIPTHNGEKSYCLKTDGNALHIYDIATDTWSTGATCPLRL